MPRNKACQQIQNLSKIGSECFCLFLLEIAVNMVEI